MSSDLVQGYDECIMSYSESRDLLLAGVADPASTPDALPLFHAILLEGRMIGHWRHVLKKASVAIETSFYRSLGRGEMSAFDAAAEDYGRFVARPLPRP